MDFNLTIGGQNVTALAEGNITLTTERRGSPGKLTCSLLRLDGLTVNEGATVTLTVQGTPMFKGYAFRNERDKNNLIPVTAYDQIRYMKNKKCYNYELKKASEVLRMVCDDFELVYGDIADTGYVIPARDETDQTIMDTVYNAVDLTLIHTGELFIMYDDYGSLTLKNMWDMRLDSIISTRENIIDYRYIRDIDTDTYNQINLYRVNEAAGVRVNFIDKDTGNIAKWGLLQLYQKVDDSLNDAQVIERAQQLLKNHNRVKQSLSIDNLSGDLRVRGGSSLYVDLNDQEISIVKLLVVRKCVHTFSHCEHTMRLELEGMDDV